MIIRPITIDDAKDFVLLNKKLVQETEFLLMTPEETSISTQQQKEKITDLKNSTNRMIFVAEDDGTLTGFLGTTIFTPQKMNHTANFVMAVLAKNKKRGIGTALLQAAENWLQKKNISRLEMTVMAHNIPAIAFYQKNGFVKEGVRKQAIAMNDQRYDELYMAKIFPNTQS